MPRKKSIKQKVSQKVIQTVKVIVGDVSKKRRAGGGRRKPRAEPQVETISAKTLAPVFIQPPILSQQYPFDLSMPPSMASSLAAQRRAAEPKEVAVDSGIPEIFEPKKASAQPLFPSAKEQLEDVGVVVPVSKEKKKNFIVVDKLPENPTTSVDSNIPIEEGYGVFFNLPLKDTSIFSRPDEFANTLADVDKQPTNYELDPLRDIAAMNANLQSGLKKAREEADIETLDIPSQIQKGEEKRKSQMRKISREIANDLLLFAKDPDLRNMSPEEAVSFITSKRQELGISAKQFRKMYILSSEKQKQLRDVMKDKAKEFDIRFTPSKEKSTSSLRIDNPLYETVMSPTK